MFWLGGIESHTKHTKTDENTPKFTTNYRLVLLHVMDYEIHKKLKNISAHKETKNYWLAKNYVIAYSRNSGGDGYVFSRTRLKNF